MDMRPPEIRNITITPEILKLIAEIDEFKGRWKVMESLAPEKLTSLRRIATIESVGSSTRIEGAELSLAWVLSAQRHRDPLWPGPGIWPRLRADQHPKRS